MIKIAPSILSADFGRLADDIHMVEEAGAHMIHVDVMDGHFVPNLTYGPLIVRKCRELTNLPLDVHLMISNAEQCLDQFIDAGSDYISIHQEAIIHLQRTLEYLQKKGVKAGVALNPATPVETVQWITDNLDFVLVMTVNPGFEAQSFIPQSLDKIRSMKELLEKNSCEAEIEVDGGIGPANAIEVIRAGANILVSGSAVFKAKSPRKAIRLMSESVQ